MRLALVLLLASVAAPAGALRPNAKLHPVSANAVHWTRGFWADRFDTAYRTTLPAMWQVINNPDNGASFVTFKIAAGLEQTKTYATVYSDGDCYKWLESAAHIYAQTHDPSLATQMDEVIAVIAKAQAPDGYISTPLQIANRQRWQNLNHHELYNMGHLMTAACVHHRATGKDSLLRVATRAADYLYGVFTPRPVELAHFGFNPSQIMGLVELYRTTGNRNYLDLARTFVAMRGSQRGGSAQNQDRTPLRKETEAVGHAVTASYLYAGATDVLAETADPELRAAIHRIWDDIASRKLYVTGAIGSLHKGATEQNDLVHESFGLPHELPNRTAYTETCANIGNALWNWRLLMLTGDARYADLMERVLYNSMLSGISLKGTEFFYTNVLRRDPTQPLLWNDTAQRWSDTASRRLPNRPNAPAFCCPPNVLRMLASSHEYAYALSDGTLWVNLYGSNELRTREFHITQQTNYPWDGSIHLNLNSGGNFAVRLRIPGWTDNATIRINGQPANTATRPGTYAELRRDWKPGDRIDLDLPMPAHLIAANPQVEQTRNQVAVMRGPLVYCLESVDLPNGVGIDDIALPADARFEARSNPDLLGGVIVLSAEAHRLPANDWGNTLYRIWQPPPSRSVPIKLIPYYAWSNRGISATTVWLPLTN